MIGDGIRLELFKTSVCLPRRTNGLDPCVICLSSVSKIQCVCRHALITADFDLAYVDKSAGGLHLIEIQDHLSVALQVCPDVCG